MEQAPYTNQDLDVETRVEDLLARMTLDEKVSILKGKNFWVTPPVKRLGLPSFGMTDGPHGVGPHSSGWRKSTYFPTSISMGSTWNPEIARTFGEALGRETRASNRHVILGPGVNIQRSPMCGRTFEYLTEDPFLNGELAVAIVEGVQSTRISACVKHFAANNQETRRMSVSAEVSERALQEVYLPAFKAAVTRGNAWSVMACYNRVNGVFGCENHDLLTRRLRDEWGFTGFVVSDWFATKGTSGAASCLNAGLTLEMPGKLKNKYKTGQVIAAVQGGDVTMATLDEHARRMLRAMIRTGLLDDPARVPAGVKNVPAHHEIAKKIAMEGMVLLKNEGNLLPLDAGNVGSIAVLGPNAGKKHGMWGGSSQIRAQHEITPLAGLKKRCGTAVSIVKNPAGAGAAIVFVGLNHRPGNDSEGMDRKRYDLPAKQEELILDTVAANPRTIVVLVNGSPVGMERWIDKVPAVLEAWYGGMEAGTVIAGILFGDVNPSGKLPVSFPKQLADSPAHASPETFPGGDKVFYREGIFVGYRHFDTRGVEPRFCFGHGLSFTTFGYSDMRLDTTTVGAGGTVTATCTVTNTGTRPGAEVVQCYVRDVEASVERPDKELKSFAKVHLQPGESRVVSFTLGKEAFSFYDETKGAWVAEPGKFEVLVGASSRDIRLSATVTLA